MGKSVLVYLKDELKFRVSEWVALAEEDKEWYKNAAQKEMEVLGIEVKQIPA